jgi:hypothetical protein
MSSPLDTMRTIAGLRGVSSVHKAVLYALALRANNETGECWPSYRTIAADAGVAPSTVKRVMGELVSAGHVSKRARPIVGKAEADSNVYRLHVKVVSQEDHVVSEEDHPPPLSGAEVVSEKDHRGLGEGPRVVSQEDRGGLGGGQELLRELPNGTANGTYALTGDPGVKSKKAKKSTKDTAEPTPSADLIALRDHYVERYAATHEDQKPAFSKTMWSRAMGALKELLALRGSLEAASAIVTHAFADPWTSKNRPQPWELLADANKHVIAPTSRNPLKQGNPDKLDFSKTPEDDRETDSERERREREARAREARSSRTPIKVFLPAKTAPAPTPPVVAPSLAAAAPVTLPAPATPKEMTPEERAAEVQRQLAALAEVAPTLQAAGGGTARAMPPPPPNHHTASASGGCPR